LFEAGLQTSANYSLKYNHGVTCQAKLEVQPFVLGVLQLTYGNESVTFNSQFSPTWTNYVK